MQADLRLCWSHIHIVEISCHGSIAIHLLLDNECLKFLKTCFCLEMVEGNVLSRVIVVVDNFVLTSFSAIFCAKVLL